MAKVDKLLGFPVRTDPTLKVGRIEFHKPGCGCRGCNPTTGPRCQCGHEMKLHTKSGVCCVCWVCACTKGKEEK